MSLLLDVLNQVIQHVGLGEILHHSIEEAGVTQVVDALDWDKCAIHWSPPSLSVHILSGFL